MVEHQSDSVIPPSPMDVKKLIANLVFLGNIDSCIEGSLRRSFNIRMPDNSWNKILMNIREEDVVSSSVYLISRNMARQCIST